jgi:hypothetical protein
MRTSTLVCAAFVLIGCGKKADETPAGATAAGSGTAAAPDPGSAAAAQPAPPVEDVPCDVAAKEYTKKMAVTPGNVLSDAKPDDGLIYYTSISMEDYCVGEGGCCVPWTAQERACVKSAEPAAVAACFTGAALAQVNAGLNEVVTTALENKRKNEAAKAAGSGTP